MSEHLTCSLTSVSFYTKLGTCKSHCCSLPLWLFMWNHRFFKVEDRPCVVNTGVLMGALCHGNLNGYLNIWQNFSVALSNVFRELPSERFRENVLLSFGNSECATGSQEPYPLWRDPVSTTRHSGNRADNLASKPQDSGFQQLKVTL